MYYVLVNTLETFKGRLLYAAPDREMIKKLSPSWWLGRPFKKKPRVFKYAYEERAPLRDYIIGSGMMPLCSKRLMDIFRICDVNFESFPALIVKNGSDDELSRDYHIFHPLEYSSPGIDLDKSVIVTEGNLLRIQRIVVSSEILESQPMLYFPAAVGPLMFLHEKLVSEIKASSITGMGFVEVEKYQL